MRSIFSLKQDLPRRMLRIKTMPTMRSYVRPPKAGVEARSDMAPKTGGNLLPKLKHRQSTEIGRKSATVCDWDNFNSSLFVKVIFVPNQR